MQFKRINFYSVFKMTLLITATLLPALLSAQDDQKLTRKQKKAHQKKEQQVQDTKKAEIKGKKRHMKLQDKKTRKRIICIETPGLFSEVV
jgi:hypothetical protein